MNYDTLKDEELIELSKTGDTAAFDELLVRTIPKTKSLLLKNFFQPHLEYDEAIQRASIRAWQCISSFGGKSAFSTWFFQIAKNNLIDETSRGKKIRRMTHSIEELSSEKGSSENGPSDFVSREALEEVLDENASSILMREENLEEQRQIIQETIKSLSPKHSQVFDLIFNKNLSYKEAAEKCKCSIGTVMSRLHFARKYAQRYITSRKSNRKEVFSVGK